MRSHLADGKKGAVVWPAHDAQRVCTWLQHGRLGVSARGRLCL